MDKPSGERTAADYLQKVVDELREGKIKADAMSVYCHSDCDYSGAQVISRPNGTYTLKVKLSDA